MILVNVDASKRVLEVSYCHHVDALQALKFVERMRMLLEDIEPGFLLFTDLSDLESMDAACAPHLGAAMELCEAKGLKTVVRVIPDPRKDIGFALISLFHYGPNVCTKTYDNLAEAMSGIPACGDRCECGRIRPE